MLGFARPYGVLGDCCMPAPSVMEFDADGKLLRSWGGPADADKCRADKVASGPRASTAFSSITTASCTSAATDVTGNNPAKPAWASTHGSDGLILKFTKDGKFVMMIGGPTKRPGQQQQGPAARTARRTSICRPT